MPSPGKCLCPRRLGSLSYRRTTTYGLCSRRFNIRTSGPQLLERRYELVPWSLTLPTSKMVQLCSQMPRACPVVSLAPHYKNGTTLLPDATGLPRGIFQSVGRLSLVATTVTLHGASPWHLPISKASSLVTSDEPTGFEMARKRGKRQPVWW